MKRNQIRNVTVAPRSGNRYEYWACIILSTVVAAEVDHPRLRLAGEANAHHVVDRRCSLVLFQSEPVDAYQAPSGVSCSVNLGSAVGFRTSSFPRKRHEALLSDLTPQ
jgi:hypothetical protein